MWSRSAPFVGARFLPKSGATKHSNWPCGAIRAGIVPVPLNTLLTADQYAYILADCRARVLFVSEALYPVIKDVVGRMPDLEHVVVSGAKQNGHKQLAEEIAGDEHQASLAARSDRDAPLIAVPAPARILTPRA